MTNSSWFLFFNIKCFVYYLSNHKKQLKRSDDPGPEVGDPTLKVGGTTPEGSLTLVSNLLMVVANIGLDILGKFTKLNITKYWG